VIECTAATDMPIGIARRAMRDTPGLTGADNTIAANSGDSVEVYGPGAVAPALAGAAIATVGTLVTSNASGLIVAATGATTRPVGWTLEAASGANVEVQIFVHPFSATVP